MRKNYGAGPLHLLSAVAMGAIVLYALIQIAGGTQPLDFALWFAGAVVAHDLLAFPLYSTLGLIAGKGSEAAGARPGTINYLRVPAFLSAIALIAWFPLILGINSDYFEEKTGVAPDGYFAKWLLLTAALALGSALVYAISARRRSRSQAPETPSE